MGTYHIDEIDRTILSFLVKDARMPYLEIARHCDISGVAVKQRVTKMTEAGIITGSRLMVKPSALGLSVCAFISINLTENNKYREAIDALKKVPEVVECHFVTGRAALLVKVFCTNNEHLMGIILNTIQRIPFVQSTDTMISLDQAIERQIWVADYSSSFSARE